MKTKVFQSRHSSLPVGWTKPFPNSTQNPFCLLRMQNLFMAKRKELWMALPSFFPSRKKEIKTDLYWLLLWSV